MGEAHHSTAVGGLTCQETGTAWGACRCSTEGMPKEHALFSESLDVWGWDGVTVGLNVTTGIMGVDIQDVRVFHGHTLLQGTVGKGMFADP